MLLESTILAGITAAGFFNIFNKLPKTVRDFAIKHPLMMEIFMLLLTYGFLGFTIMAHMAGGQIVLMTACGLYIAGHKENFLYLWDAKNAIDTWLGELKKSMNERGKRYREEKAAKQAA